jgi:acyl carrier protein phosphodiesterase
MNYLAHAFLSNNQTPLLVGNFIADHLRGNNFGDLPKDVIEGVYLHRKIDTFTDAHPEFKKAKRIFYDGFEKHSGILVDIYFDHLLAKNFEAYSELNLHDFSRNVYQVYSNHLNLLPQGSSRFLEYVVKNNIYHTYSKTIGIETVLFHLSNRIKHQVQLHESLLLFSRHEEQLQSYFSIFFKDALHEFKLL